MFSVRLGTTRVVILCNGLAVKIARGDVGRACNLEEAKVWSLFGSHARRGPHLCPVLWCHEQGLLLVMEEAGPATEEQVAQVRVRWWDYDPSDPADKGDPAEPKVADWGLLEGRVVAVDYAVHAL